jgi:hypothetical protein
VVAAARARALAPLAAALFAPDGSTDAAGLALLVAARCVPAVLAAGGFAAAAVVRAAAGDAGQRDDLLDVARGLLAGRAAARGRAQPARDRVPRGRGPVRLWRNNTGALVDQQGRFVRFGLCKGSSDLIGLRALEITPELVGQRIAQFIALEVKTAQGVLSPEQRAFLRLVKQLGGVAAICRSVEEAEQLLDTPRQMLLGR